MNIYKSDLIPSEKKTWIEITDNGSRWWWRRLKYGGWVTYRKGGAYTEWADGRKYSIE